MGLFGSIGRAFGGALKVAGKVAGVASTVAPIPGLGAAGKLARGLGGALGKAQRAQRLIQSVRSGGNLKPGVLAGLSPVMPGGAVLVSGAQAMSKAIGKRKPKRRRSRMETYYRRGRRIKRRRGPARRRGLTPAQLRAGFGGKRRMRRS